jgi:hypothetical protein
MMPDEPLKPPQAKLLIREILENGIVTYSQPHAIERLKKHHLSQIDCENVLYGGAVRHPEYENGTWRYQVHSPKMCVVIRFQDVAILQVITAWRISK